jgi:hypothetical protein
MPLSRIGFAKILDMELWLLTKSSIFEHIDHEGACDAKRNQYRTYAEECRKLAQKLKPEHRDTLMKIAAAWDQCATEVEAARKSGDDADNDNDNDRQR